MNTLCPCPFCGAPGQIAGYDDPVEPTYREYDDQVCEHCGQIESVLCDDPEFRCVTGWVLA